MLLVSSSNPLYQIEDSYYNGYDGVLDVTFLGSQGGLVVRTYAPIVTVVGELEKVELLDPVSEAYLKLPLGEGLVCCLRGLLEKRKKEI